MELSDEIKKKRGERLKSVLEYLNMSQKEFGEYCNIPSGSINKYINYAQGHKEYLTSTRIDLIRTYFPQIRHEYLMGEDDYMTDTDKMLGKLSNAAAYENHFDAYMKDIGIMFNSNADAGLSIQKIEDLDSLRFIDIFVDGSKIGSCTSKQYAAIQNHIKENTRDFLKMICKNFI